MSVLPTEVHNALSALLKGLQSADNVERTASEEALNQEWVGARPEVLLMGLTEQMQLAQDTSVSTSIRPQFRGCVHSHARCEQRF